MYKLSMEPSVVIRLSDNTSIPFDSRNSDYQTYLKWLDGYEYVVEDWVQTKPEGNTPLPADDTTTQE